MTIYRLYHTHSLGSVEPTIALSESLWSRIVTQNQKKKYKKIIIIIFASVYVFVVLFVYFPTPMTRLNLIVWDESMFRSPELHVFKINCYGTLHVHHYCQIDALNCEKHRETDVNYICHIVSFEPNGSAF